MAMEERSEAIAKARKSENAKKRRILWLFAVSGSPALTAPSGR
jgi:hypothetical protein